MDGPQAAELLPEGLELAPLWRRAAAMLINIVLRLGFLVTGGFSVYRLGKLSLPVGRVMRQLSTRLERPLSTRTRMLMEVPALALHLDGRNRRTIGAKVVGIRRADLATGGPVTARSGLIQYASGRLYAASARRITRPMLERSGRKMADIEPELSELRQAHADDPAAGTEAIMQLYRDRNINPLTSCVWGLSVPAAGSLLPVLLSRRRQSLVDRLAGIVVVTGHTRVHGESRRAH